MEVKEKERLSKWYEFTRVLPWEGRYFMEVKGLFIPAAVLSEKALTPISKMIYGLISFREQGNYGACTESAKSMAAMLGVTEKTIRKGVNDLTEGGYIKKTHVNGAGMILKTTVNSTAVTISQTAVTFTPTAVTFSKNRGNFDLQRKEEETKEETKKKKGDKSPRGKAPAFSPFSSLPDGEVKEALMDYAEVRKGSKSPIKTPRQEKLLLNKLEELSGGDTAKKVKIIEAAIMSGWKMFYPLKDERETPKPPARRSDVDPWQGRLIPPQ